MRRREFITMLGGAALAWPVGARAQQSERMRRIGVLMNLTSDDPEGQGRLAAFLQGLQEADWSVGRNVRIDLRWGAGDTELYRSHAAQLIALAPDVMLAAGGVTAVALQRATRTIPIVFANAADPVGGGLVASLARPGGNATGTTTFEFSMGGKWLDLLKEIAPKTTRAAVLRDSSNPTGIGVFGAIQTAAPVFGVELRPLDVRDANEIERAMAAFASTSNGGVIVTQNALAILHRKLIITLAARHRLPAIYAYSSFVTDGGLISYGPAVMDGYRRAAGYVDRILKGAKPDDLPVQAPTKYETGDQPRHCQGARSRGAALAARARGPGDRIVCLFAAVRESSWHDSDEPITAAYVRSLG
jgi:putative ABC transport system substrate-binding protein